MAAALTTSIDNRAVVPVLDGERPAGAALPPLRSGPPRPWWARVLRARRLVPQR